MRRSRSLSALGLGALLSLMVAVPAARAADPASETVADAAAAFLAASQQTDGGFEVAGFGFETPDAVLALAEAGQTGASWSEADAVAAVQAVETAGGLTALDFLDDQAEAPGLGPDQAAKLIVLDVIALGLDPEDFDPSDDSADPVDLVAVLDSAPQVAFNEKLYGVLADVVLGRTPDATVVQEVVDAQQANGGWGFAGDPAGTDVDPDTTGLAIQALVASGLDGDDTAVVAALAMLAAAQLASGAWAAPFDDPPGNPNSTALAILGIAAAGYDPTVSCWRDTVAPGLAGQPYANPDAYIRGQQAADGHIASPVDQFGVNTFATSQSIQALLRRWLPVAADAARTCQAGPGPTTPSTSPSSSVPELARTGAAGDREGNLARLALALIGAGLCAMGIGAAVRPRRLTR